MPFVYPSQRYREILGPQRFRIILSDMLMRFWMLGCFRKIVHICGSLNSVYKIYLNCTVMFSSFDSIVPISEIKAELPKKAIMGNISTHALGTMPRKNQAIGQSCQQKGMDIIAPACGLPTTTPLTNIRAMVEAVRDVKTLPVKIHLLNLNRIIECEPGNNLYEILSNEGLMDTLAADRFMRKMQSAH